MKIRSGSLGSFAGGLGKRFWRLPEGDSATPITVWSGNQMRGAGLNRERRSSGVLLKEKIRMLRQRRGMTQTQLAEASGVNSSTISRIENGLVSQVTVDTLLRVARALEVPVDYLLSDRDAMVPNDLVRVDTTAQYILRRYEQLSARGREQLKSFVRFLSEQEESHP